MSDRQPFFSVVVPAFNSARFISETLGSLAAQTFRDFEVIVVDDDSTDGTLELASTEMTRLGIAGMAIARPSTVAKGAAGARNAGVGLARGRWVAFLDSDDLFAPPKLQLVAAAIQDSGGDGFRALCHPSSRFADDTGADLGEVGRLAAGAPRRLITQLLREGNWFATCGIVIERSLMEELDGFDTSLHGVEDWWLVIRVSLRTPWAYLDEPLASIRIRPQSLMQGRSYLSYARQYALLLRAAKDCPELMSEQLDDLRNCIATGAGRHYAARAIGRGEWRDVVRGGEVYARAGFPDVGFRILAHHGRLALLHGASRMARSLRSVLDRPATRRAP